MSSCNNIREGKWTESIAVGNKNFEETIKDRMGILAKRRKILEKDRAFHIREEKETYIVNFEGENGDIVGKNSYFGDVDY